MLNLSRYELRSGPRVELIALPPAVIHHATFYERVLRSGCMSTSSSLPEEAQQLLIDSRCVGPSQAVWSALYYHQASLDRLRRSLPSCGDGEDTVGVTVNHQGRYIDAFEVVAEIGQPCRDALQSALRRSADCNVPTELDRLVADQRPTQSVQVVEMGDPKKTDGSPQCQAAQLEPSGFYPISALGPL